MRIGIVRLTDRNRIMRWGSLEAAGREMNKKKERKIE